jgi:O-antigen/teichoic acid export membrane protein
VVAYIRLRRQISRQPRPAPVGEHQAVHPPAISPVAWLTILKVTQQALWLILFFILAPLLGPRSYGQFAIAMAFIGFCEFVLLEGTVEALVTVHGLEPDHWNTANLVNIGTSIALSILLFVLAPYLGYIFHDGELKWVIWLLSPLPLLTSLSAPPIAVLRRSLNYKRLAIRSVLALTIGGIFGIIFGIMGGGVFALVVQVLAQRLAELTIAWVAVPIRFGCTWSARHFNELRPVAANVLSARMASLVTGQFPRVVLGYALGPAEVGFFSLANRFIDIIIQTNVVPPTEVGRIEMRTAQSGTDEFARRFEKVMQRAAVLAFPGLLGLAALAPELFGAMLGPRWEAGIVPTQILLLSGLPLVAFYSIDAALLASNLSSIFRKIAHWQGLTIMATVLCAAPFGLDITCLALAIRSWIALPVLLIIFRRTCQVPVYRVLVLPALRSLIGAVCMAAFVSLPFFHPLWASRVISILLPVGAGLLFYVAYLYCFAHRQLMELLIDCGFPLSVEQVFSIARSAPASSISRHALERAEVIQHAHGARFRE